ncbi:L-type lectin-domain containing receptor kinase IX.1 [Senna tora]|uniref:non-specific serine/threonine protein kinase n=1 Tax=Senna tora TaxID=362788 RepID=A0A834XGX9_9FABA|nr:L-type lectin-domain containing receptor kinase IX.1 [Senna tora]
MITPLAYSLNFSFHNFDPNDKRITLEGNASIASSSIQLTPNQNDQNMTNSSGRATYTDQPVHLWDSTTGKVTDFTTHFSFVISSGLTWYGDGMAFFLAPQDSKLPNDSTGGAMGLTQRNNTLNSEANQFVAVEFDTYQNSFDPPGQHVGVDINSMRSVANVTWVAGINEGTSNNYEAKAKISYNSSSQNFSVLFTTFSNNTRFQGLHYKVDLSRYLPEWVIVGFSASTGAGYAIHKINSWNFTSTLEEITNTSLISRSKSSMTGLGVGLGVGGFVLICGLCLVLFVLWKRRKNKNKMEEDNDHVELDEYMREDFERGAGPKKFSYAELAIAANYFKHENKLGQGGFGGVYRGFLKDSNSDVAIKKVSEGSKQGIKEFASEVRIISHLRHRNLVQLIGWCHERKELLLVYEYMPNGSLDFHLFKSQPSLTWTIRFKIAQDLASALLYLHEEWEQCVLHRDIKSSNIMLDSKFNAKLGDFGLARFVDHAKGAQTTALAGTMGYMAPESFISGKASKESDVYSFGVVALEIACGRKPINPKASENEINIVEWVWGLYGSGRILEAVDPRLSGDFEEKQIKSLMIVGLWCAHPDHNTRPSIRQVIQVLNFEATLPTLPSSLPVPTYSSTNVSEVSQNQNTSFSTSNTNSSSAFTSTSDDVSPSVFPRFDPNDKKITYEGSASPVAASSSIQLTTHETFPTSGRATYYQPMLLWDNTTGKLTDFTTNFSFTITSQENFHGDGMTFFLAPLDFKLAQIPIGGAMGLPLDNWLNSSNHPFVAVEFDICSNSGWDPGREHVGVDINSVKSVVTQTWLTEISEQRSYEAEISYNSNTHNLSILFTGYDNGTTLQEHLYYILDLRDYLPEQVSFGFSAATGYYFAVHQINSWHFTSTLEITNIALNPTFPGNKNSMTKLGVGLGIGGFVLICGLCLLLFGLWRRRRKNKKKVEEDDDHVELDEYMSEDFERGAGPKKFSYAELEIAANYFKHENKLGEGGFGGVYRGSLKDSDSDVAIKKVSEGSEQGIKEFASEVRIISQLRHRNLVQLIGWCRHERKELLLVYEYMPNGSLDFHLFKNPLSLTWTVRFKIAQDLASALLYLHEEWEQCVLHRDIKSSNIMLDSKFNAKLGDFGLARFVDHTKSAQTTALAGTMGYMAPESIITGRASKESDVYSFGVVALEIACGRKPINLKASEEEINIVEWVWGLYGRGRILEAVDPRLSGDFEEQQIKRLMIVGLWCAHPDYSTRPSVRQVVQVLTFEAALPTLPSTLPVPTYVSELSQNQNISFSSNTNSSAFTSTSDDAPPSVSLLHSHLS